MASKLAWGKEAVLRQLEEMAKPERSYLQSYIDYMNPRPGEVPFIESYIASVEPSTEKKSQELDSWLEAAIVVVFVAICLFALFVVVIAGIAWLLLSLLAVIIGAFAISGMGKGGGNSD